MMSGDRGLEWSAVVAVFEAEIEKRSEDIKRGARGDDTFILPRRIPALLLSRFHCIIAIIMSKIYVGLVVPACVVFPAPHRFLPFFHERGEAAAADRDFCILCLAI
jgi:hypothetical protein